MPMICIHCGAEAWRERGTGRIQLLDKDEDNVPPTPFLRGLKDDEKGCEFFIVKRVMTT